ncbi:MAG: Glu/Leu/Phe/Val dehydrogenase dimerization domain-containing protein [Rhizobiaceae bacterium]
MSANTARVHKATPEEASSLVVEDITRAASRLAGFDGHEKVLLGRDDRRGLTAIIAIHDTTLGPALGGTRIWMHDGFDAAVTDALRLSRGMTLKAAIAGLPLGGGKAVIRADAKHDKTPELFDAYAEMLAQVHDSYITAEDVGMTLADADYLRARTPNVAGTTIGGSGNPSAFTAEGVFLGIRAALKHKTGSDALAGRSVAIQGLGAVGRALADRLAGAGARLIVADIDRQRTADAATGLGAAVAAPDEILTAAVDVLAPCALGGVINQRNIGLLKAGIVAGSSNNQLLHHDDAIALKERGILYAPDYVINAGGLVNVAAEVDADGYDKAKVEARIAEIPATLSTIFAEAERSGKATNQVAFEMAEARIAAGRR